MRVAVAGKGGVGKTTLAGTLARLYARRGYDVLAIDGDLSPNLGVTLGLASEQASTLEVLPRGLVEMVDLDDGGRRLMLQEPFEEIARRYGAQTPDGVRLMLMGRPDHAGTG